MNIYHLISIHELYNLDYQSWRISSSENINDFEENTGNIHVLDVIKKIPIVYEHPVTLKNKSLKKCTLKFKAVLVLCEYRAPSLTFAMPDDGAMLNTKKRKFGSYDKHTISKISGDYKIAYASSFDLNYDAFKSICAIVDDRNTCINRLLIVYENKDSFIYNLPREIIAYIIQFFI